VVEGQGSFSCQHAVALTAAPDNGVAFNFMELAYRRTVPAFNGTSRSAHQCAAGFWLVRRREKKVVPHEEACHGRICPLTTSYKLIPKHNCPGPSLG